MWHSQLQGEGVDYCLLDFSINKYVLAGWDAVEIVRIIYDHFERFFPGGVGLVLSLTYESPRERQEQYAALIENPEAASRLVGIDLVGDEGLFDHQFYKPILTPWRAAGKMVRAHVGESQSADNIRHAIEDLEVTNIAHGIKLFDSPGLVSLAADRGITFDLALTSNYLTGVWRDTHHHPLLDMIEAGLSVTIGSDDPTVCDTTLASEYQLAERLGAACPILADNAQENAKRWMLPR
jgi:adenosine deaminase